MPNPYALHLLVPLRNCADMEGPEIEAAISQLQVLQRLSFVPPQAGQVFAYAPRPKDVVGTFSTVDCGLLFTSLPRN